MSQVISQPTITDPAIAVARFGKDLVVRLKALPREALQVMAQHEHLPLGPLNPNLPSAMLAKLIAQRMTGKPKLVCLGEHQFADPTRWRVLFVDMQGSYHPQTIVVEPPQTILARITAIEAA